MFKSPYRGHDIGLDLFVLDIERGRDTGVPPFHVFVEFCLSIEVKSWEDLAPLFTPSNLKLLKKIYESPFDIDAIAGMELEKIHDGLFGTIGKCMIGEQFYRTRCADRFFFSHRNHPYRFSPGLNNIFSR